MLSLPSKNRAGRNLSWFNHSQQPSTMQPLTPSPGTQWDGGEN